MLPPPVPPWAPVRARAWAGARARRVAMNALSLKMVRWGAH